MIEVKNLTKSYGDFRAVDDISFTCRSGAVTGFLGPNGAGKSTAMRMIVGLTPPTSGTATMGGGNFSGIPNPGTPVRVRRAAIFSQSPTAQLRQMRFGPIQRSLQLHPPT